VTAFIGSIMKESKTGRKAVYVEGPRCSGSISSEDSLHIWSTVSFSSWKFSILKKPKVHLVKY